MKKIIFALALSLLVFPTALAAVSTSVGFTNCQVNNCKLTISDCASGLLDIYSTQDCSGTPLFEYSFSGSSVSWYPDTAGTYYANALCDDSRTHSICSRVSVSELSAGTTTQRTTQTSETTPPPSGGSNTLLYVLVVVIIAVIAFIAYRLLSKKKRPKIDYQTLYRKWGR